MNNKIRFILTIFALFIISFSALNVYQSRYGGIQDISFQSAYTLLTQPNYSYETFVDPSIGFDSAGFYIKIPRIELMKAVVKDVDPRIKEIYTNSWENGVSHGRFTAYPSQIGNSYFFGHAVSSVYKAAENNAWFTQLDEVEMDDFIYIYYQGVEYKYQVISLSVVDPDATGIYTGLAPVQKLTLQTCGPPRGSLNKRTIIDALLIDTKRVTALTNPEIYSFDLVNAQDEV